MCNFVSDDVTHPHSHYLTPDATITILNITVKESIMDNSTLSPSSESAGDVRFALMIEDRVLGTIEGLIGNGMYY
ncbi:hypothetical protein B9Z55_015688 [Caenorhabditis nigoni]|uniref:Uncharacterized protein n=1 Tax=Caenorhabditis nigoni TaxID=1611254 RepID=A0A2G5UBB6_9PELO|nr:hypothetical protein B9Z55_015688 [Caenorhabditis nigoni]